MLSAKPNRSNQISKKTQVLYRDLPKIHPIETWKGTQLDKQKLPAMMQKYIIENEKSLPQGIKSVRTMEKGTPKIIVPIKYQKLLAQRTHLELLHQGTSGTSHQISPYDCLGNARSLRDLVRILIPIDVVYLSSFAVFTFIIDLCCSVAHVGPIVTS